MIFRHAVPILYSSDIQRSIDYYVNVLGFDDSWKWDDPPTFGAVIKDAVEIFFAKNSQGNPGSWMSIFVDNVDEFYQAAKAKGAIILSPPEDMDWGIREMLVKDPDGHCLRVGQGSAGTDQQIAQRNLPANIRIVPKILSPAALQPLAIKVGWVSKEDPVPTNEISGAIVYGAVAIATDTDEVVGSVLVLSDQPGFYYIKNLMVDQDLQHHRIGTSLMYYVIEWLEKNTTSDASVYLHTGERLTNFYKQFGFVPTFGMLKRMKK